MMRKWRKRSERSAQSDFDIAPQVEDVSSKSAKQLDEAHAARGGTGASTAEVMRYVDLVTESLRGVENCELEERTDDDNFSAPGWAV